MNNYYQKNTRSAKAWKVRKQRNCDSLKTGNEDTGKASLKIQDTQQVDDITSYNGLLVQFPHPPI